MSNIDKIKFHFNEIITLANQVIQSEEEGLDFYEYAEGTIEDIEYHLSVIRGYVTGELENEEE